MLEVVWLFFVALNPQIKDGFSRKNSTAFNGDQL